MVKIQPKSSFITVSLLVICGMILFMPWTAVPVQAMRKKHKRHKIAANGPTAHLFQLLDNSFGGKLDLYLLADTYSDPSNPSQQYQRVLHVTYNKDLYFGRFTIHVRSVGKMTPAQLAIYNAKQIFGFGDQDAQEFEKINPGQFGKTGDLYLCASDDLPLAASPVTPEVQEFYDTLVTRYILPKVEEKAATKS